MKLTKIAFFSLTFLLMLATTFWASFQQNLFTEWDAIAAGPWMKATLIDFYINQLILWLWVFILEKNWGVRFLWAILMIALGSMGTSLFIIYRLITHKPLFPNLAKEQL